MTVEDGEGKFGNSQFYGKQPFCCIEHGTNKSKEISMDGIKKSTASPTADAGMKHRTKQMPNDADFYMFIFFRHLIL